eukprot:403361718
MKTRNLPNKPQPTKAVAKLAKKVDQNPTKDNHPKSKDQVKITDKEKIITEQISDQNQAVVEKKQPANSKSKIQLESDKGIKTKAIAKKRDVKTIDKSYEKDAKANQKSQKPNKSTESTNKNSNQSVEKIDDATPIQNKLVKEKELSNKKVIDQKQIFPKPSQKVANQISQEKIVKQTKAQKNNQETNDKLKEGEQKEVIVGKKRFLKSAFPQNSKPSMPKYKAKKQQEIPPEYLVQVTQPELFDPDKIEEDYKYSSAKHLLNTECCVNCTNRNVFRAVITKNHDLLRKCIESTKQISTVLLTWSPELKWTPMEWVFYNDDMESFDILMQYDMDNKKNPRVLPPAVRLKEFDTGQVSQRTYGVEINKVQTARGNRAGNEAFLQEQKVEEPSFRQYLQNQYFIQRLMIMPNIKYEHFEKLMSLEDIMHDFVKYQIVQKLLIHGKLEIAEKIIQSIIDDPDHYVNKLTHYAILSKQSSIPKKYKKSLLFKQSDGLIGIYPMHAAALNPNINILKKILYMMQPCIRNLCLTDKYQNQCIHYAAACESTEPLELLLAKNMNVNFANIEKETPIFIAIKCNRPKNIQVILQNDQDSIYYKDVDSQYPIHLAAKLGFNDCIYVLCKNDKQYVGVQGGQDKLTPLMYAVQYGQLETVKYLIQTQGADVNQEDRFQRNALTYAVRNGHLKIAAFLLQNLSYYNYPDNSKNLPLHFACAYGWIDCVKLLLKAGAGANINFQNEWGYTPLMIAMLKNHQSVVNELLNVEGIDINGIDDQGRNLLTFSLQTISEEVLTYIKFLIEEKNANPHYEDLNGRTPLFYALEAPLPILSEKLALDDTQTMNLHKRLQYEQQLHLKIMNYLIRSHNCKIDHIDKNGVSILELVLTSNRLYLLPLVIDQIDFENNPDFLIRFKSFQLASTELFDKLQRSNIKEEYLNGVTFEGNSILMHFIKQYIQDKVQQVNLKVYINILQYKQYNIIFDFEENYQDGTPF